jgi:adenylate kinase family enzyme
VPNEFPYKRICVIGSSASGKSTFAKSLAARMGCRHLELDEFYHGPNWQQRSWEEFRTLVEPELEGEAWVCDGYYANNARQFQKSDLVIWLDYPFRTVLWRVLKRTARRLFVKEELWNGNRETWRMTFSRESIVLWVFQTFWKRRREIPVVLEMLQTESLRFPHPKEAARWLVKFSPSR